MIMGLIIGVTVLIGALLMYTSFLFGEIHGHEKGLDEAEMIAQEVHDERIRGNIDRA